MPAAALVLARLIESPALVDAIRALSPPAFGALVRSVGVEDAGELVALATTEQLVAAFDEDLFVNARPGEREVFDARRFVTWLEVLLEAGDAVAAARLAELDEDFVVRALGELAIVLDEDALMMRMAGDPFADDVRLADKALASSLAEPIDGYLLIARAPDGWDAVMAAIAALDRDHRALLARVLDRAAAAASTYLDDLAALAGVLQDGEMLAEDVEAARESRRAAAGYVEPRAAAAFLALPPGPERDPITRAYFRDLGPAPVASGELPDEVAALLESAGPRLPVPVSPVVAALRALPAPLHALRLAELAYLANVLVAGGRDPDGDRFTPHAASARVLVAIERAAELRGVSIERALTEANADILFREGAAGKFAR